MGFPFAKATTRSGPADLQTATVADADFARAVIDGLSASQKTLPCRYFYDEHGSDLFEEITRQPEYYLTRTEVSILMTHAFEIAGGSGEGLVLLEFGSGSSRKTEILIKAMPGLAAYVPIDVSLDALAEAQSRLHAQFPDLPILPVHGSFLTPIPLPRELEHATKLGFFPGSTIGNFEPQAAVSLLSTFRQILSPQSRLIVGVDLVKDERVLLEAYNDAAGITAAFNLNLLKRINKTFGHTFDLQTFRHSAIFDNLKSRIEMHLVSSCDQTVSLLGHDFQFKQGETIHTENSHKYTLDGFRALAALAGWQSRRCWTDSRAWFSIHELVAG